MTFGEEFNSQETVPGPSPPPYPIPVFFEVNSF